MSVIVTAGISLTATLWQRDCPLLTSLPPTILHRRSVLMPYGSLLLPARTSLGVNACEQSYPISNPTLQSSRSYILLSIGLKCSQFLAVDLVGMWSSSAGIDVLVKATGVVAVLPSSKMWPAWRDVSKKAFGV